MTFRQKIGGSLERMRHSLTSRTNIANRRAAVEWVLPEARVVSACCDSCRDSGRWGPLWCCLCHGATPSIWKSVKCFGRTEDHCTLPNRSPEGEQGDTRRGLPQRPDEPHKDSNGNNSSPSYGGGGPRAGGGKPSRALLIADLNLREVCGAFPLRPPSGATSPVVTGEGCLGAHRGIQICYRPCRISP